MQNFYVLIVWQKAHEFVLGVYRLTESAKQSGKRVLQF